MGVTDTIGRNNPNPKLNPNPNSNLNPNPDPNPNPNPETLYVGTTLSRIGKTRNASTSFKLTSQPSPCLDVNLALQPLRGVAFH